MTLPQKTKETAEEARFVRLWMDNFDSINTQVSFRLAPYAFPTYGLMTWALGNEITKRFLPYFVVWGVVLIVAALLKPSDRVKIGLVTASLAIVALSAARNMADLRDIALSDVLSRQRTTLMTTLIMFGIFAAHRYAFAVAGAATIIGTFAFLNRGHPGVVIDSVVFIACQGVVLWAHSVVGGYQRGVAIRELTIRKRMAPAYVVANSGVDLESLEQAFDAKPRTAVYVSSDWRGYQALSDEINMERLSAALSDYYDVCETVLSEAFNGGNFYFDWIADELFIVIFETETMSVAAIAEEAVKTCVKLMKAKHRFYKQYGFPRSIDIGLSVGEAFVGMMGPASFRKATALGRIPGRSRRMQSLGKVLRQVEGDYDRLIFGQELKAYLDDTFPVGEIALDAASHAKDIADKTIYFLLPRYEDSASPETTYFEPAALTAKRPAA